MGAKWLSCPDPCKSRQWCAEVLGGGRGGGEKKGQSPSLHHLPVSGVDASEQISSYCHDVLDEEWRQAHTMGSCELGRLCPCAVCVCAH